MKADLPDIFAYPPDSTTDNWYEVVRDRSDFTQVKAHINEMWKFYYRAGLSDPHFESQFPTRLFHRWWELEVAWYLSNKGFTLESNSSGPDLVCTKNDITIYVEDVICEPGAPGSPDRPNELIPNPPRSGKGSVTHVELPERERVELLRIRNSIESKVQQYHCRVEKNHIDPQVPYVIALSPVMVPNMVADCDGIPSAVKSVYPVGQMYQSIDRKSGKVVDEGRSHRPKIQKANKADIHTNIFLPSPEQEKYRGISGILYSACNFKRTEYLPAMSHSFTFIHNYIAKLPLERCQFGKYMDFWIEEDAEYHLKNNIKSD